jgi:lysophospholipase L1-like esterase
VSPRIPSAGTSDVDLDVDATPAALRRLSAIAASFALLAVCTYGVPVAKRLRPWVASEGVPVVRMFADDAEAALPDFAEASTHAGDTAAQTAASRESTTGDLPPAEPQAGADGASSAAVHIEPSEYEGATQPIEHGEALSAFFTQLARSAQREPGAITRVAHYGDSATAADAITSTVRRRMQARFGDAGHGFILLAHGDMHYIHKDVAYRSSDGWELFTTTNGPLRPGLYGYGGVQVRGKGGESASVGTPQDGALGRKVARFELFYQRYRGGGPIELKVDGDRVRVLKTNSTTTEDAFELVEVPEGPHTFTVKPLGSEVRLYGATLERTTPGVVYDSLGLVGARADRLLNGEPEHIRRQIAHRDPDLLVLSFGGNEAGNKWLNLQQYERELTEVVKVMRAGKPEMSCLLFGPLDQAERNDRGQVVTLEALPQVVAVQRKVAAREHCAFFDAFSAMGGEGSMAKWLKAKPHLATSDLRHATPAGYDLLGVMYYKALLKAFAEHLARAQPAPTPPSAP